jgi:hypothetical protein
MSARKLSRLVGLVFVLVASIGGGGAYAYGAEHGTGGSRTVVVEKAVPPETSSGGVRTFEIDWN